MTPDIFEQMEERRAHFIFGAIIFLSGLVLGGYFVVAKTLHDGQIAADTKRVADAMDRMAGPRAFSGADTCRS